MLGSRVGSWVGGELSVARYMPHGTFFRWMGWAAERLDCCYLVFWFFLEEVPRRALLGREFGELP